MEGGEEKLGPRLARTRARSGRVEAGFKDERERRDAIDRCVCVRRLGECDRAVTLNPKRSAARNEEGHGKSAHPPLVKKGEKHQYLK